MGLGLVVFGGDQGYELEAVEGGVQAGGGLGGPGGLADRAEGDSGKRDQQDVLPGIAVLLIMQESEGERGGEDSQECAETAHQEGLEEAAEQQFFANGRHDAA